MSPSAMYPLLEMPTVLMHVIQMIDVAHWHCVAEVCKDMHEAVLGTVTRVRLANLQVLGPGCADKVEQKLFRDTLRRMPLLHTLVADAAIQHKIRRIACDVLPPGLTTLHLGQCGHLMDVAAIAQLTALSSLDLSRCEQLHDVGPLTAILTLRVLLLPPGVQRLPYPGVVSLSARACSLKSLRPCGALANLQSLDLSHSRSLASLDAHPRTLASLRTLDVHMCPVRDWSPLRACFLLSRLVADDNRLVTDVSPLAGCQALRQLSLVRCHSITDISPLTACAALQDLWVGGIHVPLANAMIMQLSGWVRVHV